MDVTVADGLVGRTVDGRYLVESRIAEGGMATVYLAVDRRLDREVALKVMHTELSDDEEYASRFVREARAAARLSHPNIVQVFDQGADRSDDGSDLLYLAMEYLPGRTLREVLGERGALTPREASSVLVPLLDALAAAHRGGIVHRDVKPENIILTDDGRVKVADFGLAKAITAPISGDGRGQLYGTAAYLAPELVSRGIADHRADLYAAGIVLFELLTGAAPFTGDDPLQVAHRHVHERVPAPSEVAPALPTDFDALTRSATALDPDQRPATAEEMLAEVRSVRASMSPQALDVRAATPQQRPAGRNEPTRALTTAMPPPTGMTATMAAPPPTSAGATALAPAASPFGSPASFGGALPRLSVHEDEEPSLVTLGPTGRRPADPRRRAIVGGSVAAGVLVVLLALVWWFVGGPGSKVPTPPVSGLSTKAAEAELQKAGLSWKLTYQNDETVKKDFVKDSDPAAGDGVKKGGTVILVISKGPTIVAVPSVAKLSLEAAEGQLDAAGLKEHQARTAYSARVDKGLVIKTDPASGTQVKLDHKIIVYVSKGPEPIDVPNVVGMTSDAAKSQLTGLKLKVETQTTPYDGSTPPGQVTAQNPTAGSQANAGDTVSLTVVEVPAGQIQVPNVVGKSYNDAAGQLSGLGFQVQQVGGGIFGGGASGDDTVVRQSADAGSYQQTGATIILQTKSDN